MRTILTALALLVASVSASAAVNVSIGINVPVYPQLVRVPGYPVYYAPSLRANYFFYDGLYWVFNGDDWYVSSWYNGPWQLVDRFDVPLYVLRVPVRYYRAAPAYFHSWRVDASPRWDVHWGSTWAQRRSGWDRWDRSSVPAAAPLPVYQRQYSGTRYPQQSQQVTIQSQNYRYQPRDTVAQQQRPQPQPQAVQQQRVQQQPPQQQRVQPQRLERPVPQERVAHAEHAPPEHAQARGNHGKGHEKKDKD